MMLLRVPELADQQKDHRPNIARLSDYTQDGTAAMERTLKHLSSTHLVERHQTALGMHHMQQFHHFGFVFWCCKAHCFLRHLDTSKQHPKRLRMEYRISSALP